MRDEGVRADSLLEGLPSRFRSHEFRLSKDPMLPKRAVSSAVSRPYVRCQACNRRKIVWAVNHTSKQNHILAELRRFNSDIYDAITGRTHVAVCTWCSKKYREEPEMFLVRLLKKQVKAA